MLSKHSMFAAVVVLALAFPAIATASTVTPETDVGMISALLDQATDLLDILTAALFGGWEAPVPTPGDAAGSPLAGGEPGASSAVPPDDPSGTTWTGSGGDESSGPWPVTQP